MIERKELNKLTDIHFAIPIYQRRYAWTQAEVAQLLKDLSEWDEGNKNDKKYFIGNIVTEKRNDKHYVIDGQQRLTTLYLISVLAGKKKKKEKEKENGLYELTYEIREEDDRFLQGLREHSNNLAEALEWREACDAHPVFDENITAIFRFCEQSGKTEDKCKTMLTELFEKAYCTLTVLDAEKFDIAKYFEVMNNRGKQLEKHQILKSYFLDGMEDKDRKFYAKVWDYCSKMENHLEDLIYLYEIPVKKGKRTKSYGDIRKAFLAFLNGKIALREIFKINGNESDEKKSILDLLKEKETKGKEQSREGSDVYRSFLSFPYFLLQVLRLYLNQKDDGIIYNDAKLLELYQSENFNMKKFDTDKKKEFIEFLFKMRVFFDYFIIRRDESGKPYLRMIDDGLNAIASDEKKRKHINIQLLFNLTSDFKTQDWIAPALAFVREKVEEKKENSFDEQIYENLWKFLEELDRCVARERLSEKPNLQDVYKSAIKNFKRPVDGNKRLEDIEETLNRGVATEHYWFYKMDYLLWKEKIWEKMDKKKLDQHTSKSMEQFTLKQQGSVEHIFPQNPTQGSCAIEKDKWEACLDCFGNLALISRHMNSKLSNQCFDHKKVDIENQMKKGTIESLKMALVIKKYNKWTPKNCCKHHCETIKLLKNDLSPSDNGSDVPGKSRKECLKSK